MASQTKETEKHVDAVPHNEWELPVFPSVSQLSPKRILAIVIIITKAIQREHFCKVFFSAIAET